MSAPLFSVVLIAKNEARTLPRLVASLKEFQERGGEIVLVDTGSTDGTPELARSLGCKVQEAGSRFVVDIDAETAEAINRLVLDGGEPAVTQAGDRFFCYSEARNYAASLASNDMVSMPDCDEEFTALDIDAINEYIRQGYGQLEFHFVYAHDELGRPAVEFIQCKMYDRRLLRWNPQCVIHEVLEPIDPSLPIKRTQLPESVLKIEHWQDLSKPRSHYLPGLAWEVYKHPDNDRNMHYLGRELLYTGRPRSAIKILKQHIDMQRWPAERAQSMIYIGDCYGLLNDPTEQALWYFRAFDLDPTRREALIRLGHLYRRQHKPHAVAALASAALEIPWHPFYANLVSNYREDPYELRYWGRGWIGDIKGAQQDLLKCLEYYPNRSVYLEHTKYYFAYPDNGIQGWMRYPELLWLYETSKTMQGVVEVGCWKGRSTHALCSGSQLGMVIAVDHFQGSKGEEQAHAEAKVVDIEKEFRANLQAFDNWLLVRSSSEEAAKQIPDHSVDMVFIDASHDYESVKRDIELWLPKARIMIAGHDFCPEWPGVRQAVTERFGVVGRHQSIWFRYVREPIVSVIIPNLGRPGRLEELVARIRETAEWGLYELVVVNDDWPPKNRGVPRCLAEGIKRARGDLFMYLGTDCEPEPGFMREAVYAMLRHFPDYDGLIGLNDGIWQAGEVATHWLAGHKLVELLGGELFHTGYRHVGCDNELTGRARAMNRYAWCERARIRHKHFSIGAEMDDVYRLGWDQHKVEQDRELLRKRSAQLGFTIYWEMRPRRIPRKAFSIWLNDQPPPPLVRRCLESQWRNLREWEYRLVTLDNLRDPSPYVAECLKAKQWVKAADRLRIELLYRHGGVYLDADMELLREPPPEMLHKGLFCVLEPNGFIANSVIGAEPGHPTVGRVLEAMQAGNFTADDGKVFEAGMEIFSRVVYEDLANPDLDIAVLHASTFLPYNHQTGKTEVTRETIGWHHFMKSWVRS